MSSIHAFMIRKNIIIRLHRLGASVKAKLKFNEWLREKNMWVLDNFKWDTVN